MNAADRTAPCLIGIKIPGWPRPAGGRFPAHCTLLACGFLTRGEVEAVIAAVKRPLVAFRPFRLQAGGVCHLDCRQKTVVGVNVRARDVFDLQTAVVDAVERAGIRVAARAQFVPHVSIAEVAPGSRWRGETPTADFVVESVTIFYGAASNDVRLGASQ